MTTRITRRSAIAGALALAAPAIGSAQAPQTITMWTFLDPARPGGRERALKQMIEGFEAANPGLRIRVEPQVWTTMAERFVLGHNARNAPDICWVNSENLGLILGTEAAADLSPVVNAWSQERRADMLLPAALQSVTVRGRVLAMPLMATTFVLMVRRDLLAAAGKTLDDLKTWDGVAEAAKAMTRDTNGDGQPDIWGMGLGIATERYSMTPAVLGALGAQGSFFDDRCGARIATPEAARAVQWQADLILRHRVTPREALAMTSDDAIDQFAAGRFAMQVISNARFEQIQRNASGWNKDDLVMAPIPGWATDRPGPAISTGWFALAWRPSPRARDAMRFIDVMASPEAMQLWSVPGGQVPMLRSVASSPALQQPENAPLKQVAAMLGTSGLAMPSQCAWARTLADFNLATQQVVLGQRNVTDALRQAERATQDRQ
ncbi:extracellular solute-binding protein [Falsiroseomonas sp. HW251]|uniref:extracellular solute-binding protein n=1 Tax=Falsiroseomonas sp. HW251 TaxID=3390998 RepID=UPI003D30FF2F